MGDYRHYNGYSVLFGLCETLSFQKAKKKEGEGRKAILESIDCLSVCLSQKFNAGKLVSPSASAPLSFNHAGRAAVNRGWMLDGSDEKSHQPD